MTVEFLETQLFPARWHSPGCHLRAFLMRFWFCSICGWGWAPLCFRDHQGVELSTEHSSLVKCGICMKYILMPSSERTSYINEETRNWNCIPGNFFCRLTCGKWFIRHQDLKISCLWVLLDLTWFRDLLPWTPRLLVGSGKSPYLYNWFSVGLS